MSPVPIIVDTDCSSDPEDMAAIKAACVYHRLGHANLLGIVCNVSNIYTPGCVDTVRKYMGLPQIPIGTLKNKTLDPPGEGTFVEFVYNNYPRDIGLASTVTDGVTIYRQLLAARTSKDVTIISLGFLPVLSGLLQSPADGISSLTGSQLLAAKVNKIVIEAGAFPSGADGWNLRWDAVSANYVVANMPTSVPLIFHADNIGAPINDAAASTLPATDPTRKAYELWGVPNGRGSAWDQIAVHHAIEGDVNAWNLVRGTASVDSTTGATSFTTSTTGSHYYVIKARPDSYYQARILDVMRANPANTPIMTWTSQAFSGVSF